MSQSQPIALNLTSRLLSDMADKKLVPELRFPEFDDEWLKVRFDNIFEFSTGQNIKQSEAAPHFEIPCVRYGELYHMYGEVINEVVNRTNLSSDELRFSLGNEILLPSAGEDPLDIGSASALVVKDVAIGRTINILRPKSESVYSQVFVSYFINQKLKRKISSLAKGVSISNVYNSDLKTLSLNLPTHPEQQKIASFLTAVDKRIALLQQKKEKLEQYKKGVMQKLFPQKGQQAPEIRFKDDEGNDFPDWEEKKLGEVGAFSKGKGISKNDIVEDGTTLCIRYGELYTTYSEVIDRVGSRTSEDSNQLLISKGDEILIPASGETQLDIARASFLEKVGIAIGGDINVFSKHNQNGAFLSYFLNHAVKKEIAKTAQGNSVVHLYGSYLKSVLIGLPVAEEQGKIAEFLTELDNQIAKFSKQIDITRTFKKGLLQKMFV